MNAWARAFLLLLPLGAPAAASGERLPQAGGKARPATRVVRAAAMIDVVAGKLVPDAAVLVEGDRIVAAGPSLAIPPGTEVIDLGTAVLLPGLIDAHVHLAWGARGDSGTIPGADEARATLLAGFTTVRNLGSTGRADVALKRAIDAGEIPGPRMQAAVAGIGPGGGVCDRVFGGEGAATDPDQGAARVGEFLAAGADAIKVCAGGGVAPSEADREACECSEALIRGVVEAAHAAGRKVAAHAQGPAAVRNALAAGVDSIEHGGLLDLTTVEAMKGRRVFLVPTLYRLDWLLEDAEKKGAPEPRKKALRAGRDLARESASLAVRSGVKIAFGTDATVFPHGSNAREFVPLVEVGLSPLEAVRAATANAAALMGWEDRVGSLEPGRFADLIAVKGNPLEDVRALERVLFVMKGGETVRNDTAASRPSSSAR